MMVRPFPPSIKVGLKQRAFSYSQPSSEELTVEVSVLRVISHRKGPS